MTTVSPYTKAGKRQFVMAGTNEPLAEVMKIRPGSKELMVGKDGDLNAGSRKDLMQSIAHLIEQAKGGAIASSPVSAQTPAEVKRARTEVMAAAMHDKSGSSLQAVGEIMGDEIWDTLGREGFSRKTLIVNPLNNGEEGRLKVRQKDVTSFFSTTNINVTQSQIRQQYVRPGEFYLLADIRIENKELAQAPGDLLDDKYQDGLEQIMVSEDKVWKRLADRASKARNRNFIFNSFTPTVFATMQNEVVSHGIPVGNVIIAYDIWPDIIADTEFSSWFSEIAKHELILQGQLGSILGSNIITDAFRHENLKVLDPGEVYFCGVPHTLGGITQRQELEVEPITGYTQSKPEKGWFMNAIEGMAIVNSRAIAKGRKVV